MTSSNLNLFYRRRHQSSIAQPLWWGNKFLVAPSKNQVHSGAYSGSGWASSLSDMAHLCQKNNGFLWLFPLMWWLREPEFLMIPVGYHALYCFLDDVVGGDIKYRQCGCGRGEKSCLMFVSLCSCSWCTVSEIKPTPVLYSTTVQLAAESSSLLAVYQPVNHSTLVLMFCHISQESLKEETSSCIR